VRVPLPWARQCSRRCASGGLLLQVGCAFLHDLIAHDSALFITD